MFCFLTQLQAVPLTNILLAIRKALLLINSSIALNTIRSSTTPKPTTVFSTLYMDRQLMHRVPLQQAVLST